MMKLKVVKRGNSLALSIPSKAGFKLNQEWFLIPDKNHKSFTLVKKIANPYKNAKSGQFYVPEEWNGFNTSEVN